MNEKWKEGERKRGKILILLELFVSMVTSLSQCSPCTVADVVLVSMVVILLSDYLAKAVACDKTILNQCCVK